MAGLDHDVIVIGCGKRRVTAPVRRRRVDVVIAWDQFAMGDGP